MGWTVLPARSLPQHVEAWDALQARTTNTPFLDSAFLLPALHHFCPQPAWLALRGNVEAPDVGALVVQSGPGMWQTFQPPQLPLGAWVQADDCDPTELARDLLPRLPGVALALGLTQLDPHLVPRPADGRSTRVLDYIDTSWVEVEGDWEIYWEARGKNLKQNCRKYRNRLNSDGLVLVVEELTSPAAVADAIREFGRLESTGWKAEGGTAVHSDNAQGMFYRSVLESFAGRGRARIVQARLGQDVVAMDLCLDNGPTVIILKTAYDERARHLSPSTLMRQDEFARWWAEGRFRRIEFYGKTLEWHTRWTSDQRRLYHVNVYRWPWLRGAHERFRSRKSQGGRIASAASEDSSSSPVQSPAGGS